MAIFPVYLLEIDMLDPVGAPVTAYLATQGYNTGPADTPPNRHYAERIVDPGSFSQSLYGGERTQGQAEPGYGGIVLSNADDGLSWMLKCAMDGRPLRLKRLASVNAPYSSAVTVLAGKAEAPEAPEASRTISIGIYDRMLDLDKPLQADRYAGTTLTADGTIEGNADLKGSVKPLVFGRVRNIEMPAVNVHQWLYQVSASAVNSIVTYDGGSPRNPAGDFPTVAAALAATALYGRFTSCMAQGIVRFVGNASARPAYVFTADVVEGSPVANRYPGAVARRILAKAGMTADDIDVAAFNALDAAAPREVGVFVNGEDTTRSVVSRVLASVGAYIIPDALGRFTTGRLAFGTPVRTYEITDTDANGFSFRLNPDSPNGVPPWRIILKYQPIYHVMDKSGIAGCVDETTRSFLSTEWREVATPEQTEIRSRHPRSEEMRVETLLDKQADAEIELARLRDLYCTDRPVIPIEVPIAEAAPIGSTVTIEGPKVGLDAGRDMIIIARTDDFGRDMAALTLWG